ncbi:MAG: D-alanine--D-alanine ligase [Planctomycetaceae bacterium]|nr:D-alanine--D-alanine ligase [Planctomycetaceae bacterium]
MNFKAPNLPPTRIAVLSGGNSFEREISLQSGKAITRALMERGHSVTSIDPASEDLTTYDFNEIDVAFIALHGSFGEDGQVQEILADAKVPYTGSDAESSRRAFSKSAAKERFGIAGVPTPDYALFNHADNIDDIHRMAESIGYPLVVKPDKQGSSIGVTIVETSEGLDSAVLSCLQFDRHGILEAAIVGAEWTVGLFDTEAFPPIHIATPRGFFDYKAKYHDEATEYDFDAELPQGVAQQLAAISRAACQSLGVSGITRVDLRVDSTLRPWVLEVNTIPGFTDHSLIPKAAAEVGLSLTDVAEIAVAGCMPTKPPLKGPHFLRRSAVAKVKSEDPA